MENEINNNLVVLETEKERAALRLKDQIRSIRDALDNLESKISNNQDLYDSDGLHGNGVYIDVYLSKVVSYTREIERLKALVQ
ncbi:hypothetical protein MOF11_13445 [Bacillus haynesii]|uniref:hypothetical protein n=1 Tax=Bacillus haynesii TaxID=1925021 RepID=UPI0022805289|nr:hypothetical protein [Bacillus haynesii]MCY9226029.1 hypothetical protein [Bacillus haynesii]